MIFFVITLVLIVSTTVTVALPVPVLFQISVIDSTIVFGPILLQSNDDFDIEDEAILQ